MGSCSGAKQLEAVSTAAASTCPPFWVQRECSWKQPSPDSVLHQMETLPVLELRTKRHGEVAVVQLQLLYSWHQHGHKQRHSFLALLTGSGGFGGCMLPTPELGKWGNVLYRFLLTEQLNVTKPYIAQASKLPPAHTSVMNSGLFLAEKYIITIHYKCKMTFQCKYVDQIFSWNTTIIKMVCVMLT